MPDRQQKPTCPECNGTKAYKPDCWLCQGEMVIPIKKTIEEGYSVNDLEDAYDGQCRCPAWDCNGDPCDLCDGYGKVEPHVIEQEITRVLLCAMNGTVPPRCSSSWFGRAYESDDLLAKFAGVECRERGWIWWFVSVFGDEISLTQAGEEEARKRQVEWLRTKDVSLRHIDDIGRFEDDGGPPSP
ncbi:hypothetical protein [Roseibium sp. Sym1]|uniref:hypothetical protein n=1 Tax=Roseibium sp. Sym1 TaxID=3016006 RepID=UPI0022B2BA64|nr:hypothetical protein [Roseibium sp. Sym1]